jgi:ankyrin repeat protein
MKDILEWGGVHEHIPNSTLLKLQQQIYCTKDTEKHCAFLSEHISDLYNNKILNPLLDIFTIKSLIDSASYIEVSCNSSEDDKGQYNIGSHNIWINGGRKPTKEELLGTFVHEITHSVMHSLFANECNPYKKNDLIAQEAFEKAEKETLMNFYSFIAPHHEEINNVSSWQLGTIIYTIYNHVTLPGVLSSYINMFRYYKEKDNSMEFIARYYQAVAIDDLDTLKLMRPLESYIEQYINPLRDRYLVDHISYLTNYTPLPNYILGRAIIKGNLTQATNAILSGADINKKNESGDTYLYYALIPGHIEIAEFLIKHGADIKEKDKWGDTYLSKALESSRLEVAEFLIKHGADINEKDKWGDTYLSKALENSKLEVAEFLIKHGADIHYKEAFKSTPLCYVLSTGQFDIAKLMIEYDVAGENPPQCLADVEDYHLGGVYHKFCVSFFLLG